MPDLQPFPAIRYDLGHVGSLSDVVAPPYDVISPDMQDDLYKRHPANVIRLILNREEPGDDDDANRYSRAARFMKNWLDEGVLFRDPQPALYVYHQEFEVDGRTITRRGFLGRVRLERFGEGKIYPHEETMAGPKRDRLALTQACRANLSPIFGLYPDAESKVQALLESGADGVTPIEAVDHLGVKHRLWALTDPKLTADASALMAAKPMFIADGHHRYETACNYRDELAGGRELDPAHPANFVLMMCVGMSDPGMIVLPTHRLFRGLPEISSEELAAKLGECFSIRIVGEGSDLATTVWEGIETTGDQEVLGLYTARDDRWLLAELTQAGRDRMAALASERSKQWRGLGVSILHRLVIDALLEAGELPKPRYVHRVDEVVEGIESGEFPLAALVMPASVDHIRMISEYSERMPAKSTYFYPKLLSGLVFHSLE